MLSLACSFCSVVFCQLYEKVVTNILHKPMALAVRPFSVFIALVTAKWRLWPKQWPKHCSHNIAPIVRGNAGSFPLVQGPLLEGVWGLPPGCQSRLILRNGQRLSSSVLFCPWLSDTFQGLLFEKSTFGWEVHIYQKPVAWLWTLASQQYGMLPFLLLRGMLSLSTRHWLLPC